MVAVSRCTQFSKQSGVALRLPSSFPGKLMARHLHRVPRFCCSPKFKASGPVEIKWDHPLAFSDACASHGESEELICSSKQERGSFAVSPRARKPAHGWPATLDRVLDARLRSPSIVWQTKPAPGAGAIPPLKSEGQDDRHRCGPKIPPTSPRGYWLAVPSAFESVRI